MGDTLHDFYCVTVDTIYNTITTIHVLQDEGNKDGEL